MRNIKFCISLSRMDVVVIAMNGAEADCVLLRVPFTFCLFVLSYNSCCQVMTTMVRPGNQRTNARENSHLNGEAGGDTDLDDELLL